MADPPRFEHGLQAPQAHVISRLHYGSSEFSTGGTCLIPTVSDDMLPIDGYLAIGKMLLYGI